MFDVDSDFVGKQKGSVKLYKDNSRIDYNTEIKLLTNDRAGSAGRSKWYVIDKSNITKNIKFINEWQVVVSSAHPGGQEGRDNQITIIDNHSAFGRSRVALNSFKTEIEAKNFYKYCKTNIIRYMFLMTDEALTSLGKKVPDIKDYTNNNKLVDFSKDLNKQLYELIGLSPEEIKFVESKITPME